MKKARKRYIAECEISEIAEVELGGFRQKISIEGRRKDLPVVICLHGGPGTPVPFSVAARGMFPEWTDRAVMVYWDQLGCGINRRPLGDLAPDDFVNMTCDLIAEIKARFPRNGLYLLGVSWGSMLALKSVVRIPGSVDGVVIGGQIVKQLFFNDGVFSAFEGAPDKIKRKVAEIRSDGKDCGWEKLDSNLRALMKYIVKYTDGRINRNSKTPPLGEYLKGFMSSPDYTFRDFKAIFKNDFKSSETIWREILKLDLSAGFAKVKIPYIIIQGETDIITPTDKVEEIVKECGNPNVSCTVVKNSGHIPSDAAMKEIFDKLYGLISHRK